MSDELEDWELLDEAIANFQHKIEKAEKKLHYRELGCVVVRQKLERHRAVLRALISERNRMADEASVEPVKDSGQTLDWNKLERAPRGKVKNVLLSGESDPPPPSGKEGEIPEGFIPWSGGECPIIGQQYEVILRNGSRKLSSAYSWPYFNENWRHTVTQPSPKAQYDIIAYRILSEPKTEDGSREVIQGEVGKEGEIPDNGWIKWEGGECPVGANELVDIHLESGIFTQHQQNRFAGSLNWSHEDAGDHIVEYRVLSEKRQREFYAPSEPPRHLIVDPASDRPLPDLDDTPSYSEAHEEREEEKAS